MVLVGLAVLIVGVVLVIVLAVVLVVLVFIFWFLSIIPAHSSADGGSDALCAGSQGGPSRRRRPAKGAPCEKTMLLLL